jgi:hypothetical protein
LKDKGAKNLKRDGFGLVKLKSTKMNILKKLKGGLLLYKIT